MSKVGSPRYALSVLEGKCDDTDSRDEPPIPIVGVGTARLRRSAPGPFPLTSSPVCRPRSA